VKSTLLLGLLAVVSGALIPVQAASNAALSRSIQGNVPFSAMLLFFAGFIAAAIVALASGQGIPTVEQLREAPWWSYSGGPIVAFYVLTITVLAPRLGIGTAISLIVAGQVIAALTIDHFGLLRSLTFQITPMRITGAALMIIGVFLALKR
jgi:transporter family-2 protein